MKEHLRNLLASYKKWTGRDLLPDIPEDFESFLYNAPFVLASHGTEEDPILNYANLTAQKLWEMDWDEITKTPSRLTAEQPEREERERFLKEVSEKGFITDYSGIRISKSGKRFHIENVKVWNIVGQAGGKLGQAAMFETWKYL